jgi:hypothetical protein
VPSYLTTFIKPIFFVRWIAPQANEVSNVTTEFLDQRKRTGQPIVYIAIVPEDCASPNDETRAAMVIERDRVLGECITMHIVMEGSGFKHAILRNAMAAMQLVVGSRDKRVIIGRTLEEALTTALRAVPEELKFDPRAVHAKAEAHGVATPTATKRDSR